MKTAAPALLLAALLLALLPALPARAEAPAAADAPAATQPAERKVIRTVDDLLADIPAELIPVKREPMTDAQIDGLKAWCKANGKNYRVQTADKFLSSPVGTRNAKPTNFNVLTQWTQNRPDGWRTLTISAKITAEQAKQFEKAKPGALVVPLEGLSEKIEFKNPAGSVEFKVRIEQDVKLGKVEPVKAD